MTIVNRQSTMGDNGARVFQLRKLRGGRSALATPMPALLPGALPR